ncbi:MAG: pentapeptide repeat-containing protein [Candidatus Thorarchaeota archaeon]
MMRRNPLPKDWNLSTSGDKFDRGRVLVFPFGGSMNQNLDGEALRDMTFIRVNLRGSSFRGADLTGTRFFNCDLRSCSTTAL